MTPVSKKLEWIEDLAKREKESSLNAKCHHRKYCISTLHLNAILAHSLSIAKKKRILDAYRLPALNLLPDKIPGKIKKATA